MPEEKQEIRNDLIGDILREYEKTGGMDNLPGAGKPLPAEYFSGDLFQHFQKIANEAGYKPHWLKLQHEIRDQIRETLKKMAAGKKKDLPLRISLINQKIYEFNKSCPAPLQKGSVTLENIERMVSRLE
ncbi:DnaJ family domain-containing protein [Planococcus sp. CAU13]|uniref:DnaJ family domain-containing protein n=1 Tax=Planococcus sp. CAU13 TaxID=1541197 RepID=UPI00052FFF6E|nr:DnaJ family domain-containing protein [Planococcus sp. CAU13]